MPKKTPPKTLVDFQKRFPDIWRHYTALRDTCDGQGPLDGKTRELIGQEVAAFTKVMDKLPRHEVLALARTGLEGTSRLLVALRKRVFLDLLGEMGVADEAKTTNTGADRA